MEITIKKTTTSTAGELNIIKNAALMSNAKLVLLHSKSISVEFSDDVSPKASIITKFIVTPENFAKAVNKLLLQGMDSDLFILQ